MLWRGGSGTDLQKRWLQERSGDISIAILSRPTRAATRPGTDPQVGGYPTRRRYAT